MNFLDTIYDCLEIIRFGYTCCFPLLFLAWLFLKKYKPFLIKILSVMNGWLALYGVYWTVYWAAELFHSWYSMNKYEGYSFFYSKGNFIDYRLSIFWWICMLTCCLLFLFKKWRKKISLSLVAVISCNYYLIVAWYITLFRDYTPSAWELVTETKWYKTQAVMLIIYVVIIFLSWHWIHAKMKSIIGRRLKLKKNRG